MRLKGELPVSRDDIQKVLDAPVLFEGDKALEDESRVSAVLRGKLDIQKKPLIAHGILCILRPSETSCDIDSRAVGGCRAIFIRLLVSHDVE